MEQFLNQNATHIVWAATTIIVIGILVFFKIWKLHNVFENDRIFKKTDLKGNMIQEGKTRDIWDTNLFPGLSRIWHKSEWQEAAGMMLMLIFLSAYLYTKDQSILFVLGVNFGVLIGTQIQRYKEKK